MQFPSQHPGWINIDGWCAIDEGDYLFKLASELTLGSTVVEIGAWHGRSTAALAMGAKHTNSHVYTVDHFRGSQEEAHKMPPSRQQLEANLRSMGLNNVTILEGDSTEMSQTFKWCSLDMLFIDGDHHADAVYSDYCTWATFAKPQSHILFHDYADGGWPSVREGVERVLQLKELEHVCDYGSIGHFKLRGIHYHHGS